MIWIYLMFVGIVIGIYGIYLGLQSFVLIFQPFGVLKVKKCLTIHEMERFREEWKRHSSQPLVILNEDARLDFHIGEKRLKDL